MRAPQSGRLRGSSFSQAGIPSPALSQCFISSSRSLQHSDRNIFTGETMPPGHLFSSSRSAPITGVTYAIPHTLPAAVIGGVIPIHFPAFSPTLHHERYREGADGHRDCRTGDHVRSGDRIRSATQWISTAEPQPCSAGASSGCEYHARCTKPARAGFTYQLRGSGNGVPTIPRSAR